jgi:Mg2+-importing ATPase
VVAELAIAPRLADLAKDEVSEVFAALQASPNGLSREEAARRLKRFGPNEIEAESRSLWDIVLEQARSGINVLLAVAGMLTIATGDRIDGGIILLLIGVNVALSIVQEYRAEVALNALRAMLPLHCRVSRDGKDIDEPVTSLVPGDLVRIRSGDLVPADLRLVAAEEIEINQAALTGESVPQAKQAAAVHSDTPADWTDVAFAGTTVIAGEGSGVVAATGSHTQFGETASLVKGIRAPGDFQVNLANFGGFLMRFGLVLAAIVFLSNALLGRGVLVSLTLALAIALGVIPEALPAVTATTLALGASHLARKSVLVRRLAAVEDLSAVDVLCSDKTGTITENRTAVTEVWSLCPRSQVLEAAVLASSFPEHGVNPIDDALVEAAAGEVDLQALAALPRTVQVRFSSDTKRQCVAVQRAAGDDSVCKGAAEVVLNLCSEIRTAAGGVDLGAGRADVLAALERMQSGGARVLAVAAGRNGQMAFVGLLGLADPPRPTSAEALKNARALGVEVKIVTGDSLPRAQALARQIQLPVSPNQIVAASDLRGGHAARSAQRGRLFANVVPADKYHLVSLLQHLGHHVAATGDGVNDAPALQVSDVGIALASGTPATKGAADLVLLKDDLAVIVDAIKEGRRTFTNINRYLLYTMVSNFANVIIVAIASLFLAYLPLLPAQVLLLNVLADLPMLAIVTDRVAVEDLATPRHWGVRHLVELSVFLGVVNAIFTFALLRVVHEQDPRVVRTAWFLFLGSTALLILFAVRTGRWFWSRPYPSVPVLLALAAALLVTLVLPNLPVTQSLLGFVRLPWLQQAGIEAFALLYLAVADLLRRAFDRYSANLRTPGRPTHRQRGQ